jgi:hypothetical protein
MIIYIATYPRSGNWWIRSKIKENYGIVSTEIYLGKPAKDKKKSRIKNFIQGQAAYKKWVAWENQNSKFIKKHLMTWEYDKELIEEKTPINLWMYKEKGYREEYALVKGLGCILKYPAIRAYFSDQPNLYIIKTHDQPYDYYHRKEKVLQVIRNPGASYWSYVNFFRDVRNVTVDLDDMMQGKVGFGSWKIYHDNYIQTEKKLGNNYKKILFEEFKVNELEIVKSLGSFLERPLLSEEITPFENYQKRRPDLARKGTAFGWEENYTREQIELLWELHKDTMKYYGYSKPNFYLAKD